MSEVKYITVNSPTLTLKLAGKRYTAVHGVLEGLTPEAMKELDHLLQTAPHIRVEVKKVDLEAAARRAQDYLKNQPKAAVQGVVTSQNQATSVLREAKKKQETQSLTNVENAVNTSTKPKSTGPLEVTEVNTAKPAVGSLLSRTKQT